MINGPFEDHGLFIDLRFGSRAILFDLGDLSADDRRVIFSDPFCARMPRLNGGTAPEALPKEIIIPSGRRQSSEPSNVSLPTASITTSTPRPPVRARTLSTGSVSEAQIAASGLTSSAARSRRSRLSSTRKTCAAPRARARRT